MNKEQIEKYERLVCERHDAVHKLNWLKDWERNLYDDEATKDERFYITITRWCHGKVVLQRDITREEAEMEFNAERLRLEADLERIEKEIEAL